jgi:hypothetical protein
MNERIKELAEQAGFVVGVSANADRQIKLFAELVIQNYASQLITDAEQARKDEREACAKLCEDEHKIRLAETIRARTE